MSAQAQGLSKAVTTAERLRNSEDQVLYLMTEDDGQKWVENLQIFWTCFGFHQSLSLNNDKTKEYRHFRIVNSNLDSIKRFIWKARYQNFQSIFVKPRKLFHLFFQQKIICSAFPFPFFHVDIVPITQCNYSFKKLITFRPKYNQKFSELLWKTKERNDSNEQSNCNKKTFMKWEFPGRKKINNGFAMWCIE